MLQDPLKRQQQKKQRLLHYKHLKFIERELYHMCNSPVLNDRVETKRQVFSRMDFSEIVSCSPESAREAYNNILERQRNLNLVKVAISHCHLISFQFCLTVASRFVHKYNLRAA